MLDITFSTLIYWPLGTEMIFPLILLILYQTLICLHNMFAVHPNTGHTEDIFPYFPICSWFHLMCILIIIFGNFRCNCALDAIVYHHEANFDYDYFIHIFLWVMHWYFQLYSIMSAFLWSYIFSRMDPLSQDPLAGLFGYYWVQNEIKL